MKEDLSGGDYENNGESRFAAVERMRCKRNPAKCKKGYIAGTSEDPNVGVTGEMGFQGQQAQSNGMMVGSTIQGNMNSVNGDSPSSFSLNTVSSGDIPDWKKRKMAMQAASRAQRGLDPSSDGKSGDRQKDSGTLRKRV